MKFYLHRRAEEELDAAVNYYEACQPGLGLEFTEAVYGTIARISEFPHAWPLLDEDIRRCLVNRFPFRVIYKVESDMIRIMAVAQLHRQPDYWRERA